MLSPLVRSTRPRSAWEDGGLSCFVVAIAAGLILTRALEIWLPSGIAVNVHVVVQAWSYIALVVGWPAAVLITIRFINGLHRRSGLWSLLIYLTLFGIGSAFLTQGSPAMLVILGLMLLTTYAICITNTIRFQPQVLASSMAFVAVSMPLSIYYLLIWDRLTGSVRLAIIWQAVVELRYFLYWHGSISATIRDLMYSWIIGIGAAVVTMRLTLVVHCNSDTLSPTKVSD